MRNSKQRVKRINLGDVLIAGIVREAGGSIVTGDNHFKRIDGLDFISY